MAETSAAYTGKPKRSPGKTILTVALVLLALIVAASILDKLFFPVENRDSDNTYGSGEYGVKAIYLSAKEYLKERTGADVERYTKIARFLPENTVAVSIVTEQNEFSVSDTQDLISYVENGGIFILVTDSYEFESAVITMLSNSGEAIFDKLSDGGDVIEAGNMLMESGPAGQPPVIGEISYEADGTGEQSVWISVEYGRGMFIFSDGAEDMQNDRLKSDKHPGSVLLVKLEQLCMERNIKKVLFDEYYSGIRSNPVPDILGYGFVLCLVELAIAAVIYFVYKGQRFGAPEKVGAEEKRSETEHIDAMAKLYRRTGSGAIGYRIHMEALIEDIGVSLGLPEGTDFNDIAGAAISSDKFRGSGLDELTAVYRNADNIRFPAKTLESYIRKMDQIRKERLQ